LNWPDTTSSRLERHTKVLAAPQGGMVILSRSYVSIVGATCSTACTQPTGQWSAATLNTSANMDSTFPLLQPCQFATWFFQYGMGAGLTPQGSLVVAYGAHGRALSGNDAGICSAGFNYNYRTVIQYFQ
jgi:hypothetical protein